MSIAITDTQAQQLIITELNPFAPGLTDDPVIDATMPIWWSLYADKERTGPGLQMLYTKRAVINYLRGQARRMIDIQIGTDDKVSANQIFKNLNTLYNDVSTEIETVEERTGNAVMSITPKSSLPDAYGARAKAAGEFGRGNGSVSVSGGAGNAQI